MLQRIEGTFECLVYVGVESMVAAEGSVEFAGGLVEICNVAGFFQAIQYPENPYYQKTFCDSLGLNKKNGKEIIEQIDDLDSIPELIEKFTIIHNIDCSRNDSLEKINNLKKASRLKSTQASDLNEDGKIIKINFIVTVQIASRPICVRCRQR